ncbi:hypothetical protein tb265_00080 [Gemmatimonadetes bacterium T265]|nr:hypothetical protein tb265_00080 [Gemmatimonadetes bacterium T265]
MRAQAKVNLFLRVLAREDAGYHQLETLFQRLDIADDVRVRVGPAVRGRALDAAGAGADALGPTERNLAWRAAVAYADATGWPDAFTIELTKAIPVGGGLGGGSADAGAVLRCFNALAPDPLHPGDLLAVAGALGADVPFLTAEVPLALAWGRGNRMLALPPLPIRRVHLAIFAEGVVTADAYGALAAARAARPAPVRPILWTADRLARWDDVALVAVNDFEDAIFPEREDIAGVRALFGDVAREVEQRNLEPDEEDESAGISTDDATGDATPIALMSGSGATVVLLTPLAGVTVGLEVNAPPGAVGVPAIRVVETRTADRVAAVVLGE